jgi:putative redox protein
MDAPERVGGEDHGPIPKPFVLSALSGCTGMDIVFILRKSGNQVDDFSIKVTGKISRKPPIEYVAIHVQYDFKGIEENKQPAFNAVMDSQEKYCGISHMLKRILPVTWEIHYNGELIFSNKRENITALN